MGSFCKPVQHHAPPTRQSFLFINVCSSKLAPLSPETSFSLTLMPPGHTSLPHQALIILGSRNIGGVEAMSCSAWCSDAVAQVGAYTCVPCHRKPSESARQPNLPRSFKSTATAIVIEQCDMHAPCLTDIVARPSAELQLNYVMGPWTSAVQDDHA